MRTAVRLGVVLAWIAPAIAIAIVGVCAGAATRPVLKSVSVQTRGGASEYHFVFIGPAPRIELQKHANELWIELGSARLDVPARPLFGNEAPPLTSLRAVNGADGSRIEIAVAGKTDYAIGRTANEIILRLAQTGEAPNIAAPILIRHGPRIAAHSSTAPAIRAPIADTASRREPAMPAMSNDAGATMVTVVIDPGHGGYDPGTSSASGIVEKAMALEIARRTRDDLRAAGVRAILTRDSDEFVSLRDRTKFANDANAALFVSIHLNSSPNFQTSGIEVYYLNNTTDRATVRLARMENGEPGYGVATDSDLHYILADLRQTYKANESASIARMIDAQAVTDLNAGLGTNVAALGAKMGPFYVLVGAHMPAVLVECGFLSNREEAVRLTSAPYQEIIAGAIADAVRHYLSADAAVGNL